MVLRLTFEDLNFGRRNRLIEQPGEIESLRLPVGDDTALIEHLHLPDHVVEFSKSQFGHQLADLLGNEKEKVDDMLGLTGEALAQYGILGGDADRTSVEMALAHHDATCRDQRRRGEAELVGAK